MFQLVARRFLRCRFAFDSRRFASSFHGKRDFAASSSRAAASSHVKALMIVTPRRTYATDANANYLSRIFGQDDAPVPIGELPIGEIPIGEVPVVMRKLMRKLILDEGLDLDDVDHKLMSEMIDLLVTKDPAKDSARGSSKGPEAPKDPV